MDSPFRAYVSMKCPECNQESSGLVVVPEPGEEGLTSIGCNHCGAEFSTHAALLDEGGLRLTLKDYPEHRVETDSILLADYGQENSADPYDSFLDAMRSVDTQLKQHGDSYGGSMMNRMLFVTLISIMEAYLEDTLTKCVVGNDLFLRNLINRDKQLNAKKFDLLAIAENPNLVSETVVNFLKSFVYHDVARVDALYQSALGVKFLGDGTENAKLFQAIRYRQHCVHRNGRDKDGNFLKVFTTSYVRQTYDLIHTLVLRLDTVVWPEFWVQH